MDRVKKKLGFGGMRFPMKDGKIDEAQVCQMVDEFIAAGFNYFDTAHGYHGGLSEVTLNHCLTSRHPREDYLLTNKLTDPYFQSQEDIRPFFEKQLELCGVEYFDFYLMHAQGKINYPKFQRCKAYETAFELKKEGKIRHVGLSFHDTADVLERILCDHPDVEVVQIQFNYNDYEDPAVQSRKVYEVCRKYDKPILVMEPVKGGSLAALPPDAAKVLDDLHGGSQASYALRFAAGFDGMLSVLSGMSNIEQMRDNISFMSDLKPLNDTERAAIEKVCQIMHSKDLIPCTSCRYCIDGCPKNISIPDLFSCMNSLSIYHGWNPGFYYNEVHTIGHGKASDCIKCGKCEKICPQHLPIRDLLVQVANEFEK
ncbi:MAG: aldo/keto reductase [Oscillospiraceae bacterium]|nr:aldo/keto reductase [Oscillospiraceae bacterium]